MCIILLKHPFIFPTMNKDHQPFQNAVCNDQGYICGEGILLSFYGAHEEKEACVQYLLWSLSRSSHLEREKKEGDVEQKKDGMHFFILFYPSKTLARRWTSQTSIHNIARLILHAPHESDYHLVVPATKIKGCLVNIKKIYMVGYQLCPHGMSLRSSQWNGKYMNWWW